MCLHYIIVKRWLKKSVQFLVYESSKIKIKKQQQQQHIYIHSGFLKQWQHYIYTSTFSLKIETMREDVSVCVYNWKTCVQFDIGSTSIECGLLSNEIVTIEKPQKKTPKIDRHICMCALAHSRTHTHSVRDKEWKKREQNRKSAKETSTFVCHHFSFAFEQVHQ